MKIIDELKFQAEQRMHTPLKQRNLSNNDKVMFLTKVLYDRLNVKEACSQLRIPLNLGQSILDENITLLKTKTQYKKHQKRPKTINPTSSTASLQDSEHPHPHPQVRTAGFKAISKDYEWRNFSITFAVDGKTHSNRTLDTQFQTIIKDPTMKQGH